MSDYREFVIVDLADENAALRERAALAEGYKAELLEAIERLGEKMRELETAHRLIARLRAELAARDEPVAA